MSQTITLSLRASDFNNVLDEWFLGPDENYAGSTHDYLLPAGYSVAAGPFENPTKFIYDVAGRLCAIATHSSGRPQLISMSGPVVAQPVLALA